VLSNLNTTDKAADIDGSGKVDVKDLSRLISQWSTAGSAAGGTSGQTAVIAAVGDIACDPASSSFKGGAGTANNCRDRYVANAVKAADPAAVLLLGDLQYENGTLSKFMKSFDKNWGSLKDKLRPAVGNHEYKTAGAKGYFDYFNGSGKQTGQAGERGKGYYSYNVGDWHLIALNSNCSAAGGCAAGSAQEKWLRADLKANPGKCVAAYWHHPRWSSGNHGNDTGMGAFVKALYDNDAELILNGHDHIYERFAPQDPSGKRDDAQGVREFIVGTGGKNEVGMGSTKANSQVRQNSTHGFLKLTLKPGGYDWKFVAESGKSFTDSGSGSCH
jgi:hypothetical protein